MSRRARLFALGARRETAALSRGQAELARARREAEAAGALVQRIETLLAEDGVQGPVPAAMLRDARRLSAGLAAEALRQRDRAAELAEQTRGLAAALARTAHRRDGLEAAAAQARREAAEEAERRAEAARPVPRRG